MRRAQGQGATTESPTASQNDILLDAPITAQTTYVPPGTKRRIDPPQALHESAPARPQRHVLTTLAGVVGFGGLVTLCGLIRSYGMLEQRVVSNTERIVDNQGEQKSTINKLEEIAHRITRLESQFEAADKNGTSPIRFAKELEELKEELGKQSRNASVLSDRLSDLEGRLSVTTTGPSP